MEKEEIIKSINRAKLVSLTDCNCKSEDLNVSMKYRKVELWLRTCFAVRPTVEEFEIYNIYNEKI